MDEELEQYINKLVSECLAVLVTTEDEEQKKQLEVELKDHFYNQVIQLFTQQLTPEQLETLDNMNIEDPRSSQIIEEVSAQIPGFATLLEERLNSEAERIKTKLPVEGVESLQ